MLVSLKWLKDYVNISLKAEKLAERMTMSGLEVEAIKEIVPAFTGVVTAKIISVKPHPNADNLSLCEVTDGAKKYPVVCGAKNIKAGDIVPLAKVGATIPGGYVIKEARLRGELSEGMLCSEAELEIGDDASGIMQLSHGFKLGLPLEKALDLKDTVLDINVTPNRADCLSMLGIAREAAALTNKKIKIPEIRIKENDQSIKRLTSVKIMDPELCPRYTARMIKNVTIGPSPVWLKTRLEAAGMRAINNVVDVTNFVMLEMGQPLHAFDFRFLEKGRIIVRKSKKDEEFVSLDGKSRKLTDDTLLICDGVKPIAIGGIMGGLNSEVKEDTSTILLESAYFNPQSIRRSARKLGMPTDAAFRFERGVDPEGVVRALNRAAQLIADLSGGSVCRGYIDEYPQKIKTVKNIKLRLTRVHQITGTKIPTAEILKILRSLEMKVNAAGKGVYRVKPPSFRMDLTREIDLIEEIIRIYGYKRVPETLPDISITETRHNYQDMEKRLRNVMNGMGFSEVINYSFIAPSSLDNVLLPTDDKRRNVVAISNPLTEEQSIMRPTLLVGLLDTLKKNINNGYGNLKIFELGRAFIHRQKGKLPEEKNFCAALMSGAKTDDLWGLKTPTDFFDLKGCLENLFFDLKISNIKFAASPSEPFLHPGKSCTVFSGEIPLGCMGVIHPQIMAKLDLKQDACFFEINTDLIAQASKTVVNYADFSRFPAINRDVAFVLDKKIEADYIINIISNLNEDLLENVVIFDIYEGKGIPEGTKSIGFRFSYRSAQRTLTDSQAGEVHERIIRNIVDLTKAKIRGENKQEE
ncbi:MAG TPA: phenylalanine--tRNA ligase subunit beta [Smithellaceae bacterium]|nr:phenylalanine--tRNA ligase subunit beta [Smithellaceae bacterium]HRS88331.1 phenylalanine--tRNA ligase subunit beta [Smithellaceae bacterium]HRV24976.1 phenylalanine--tRNA ligase subunit beta [Smithellaceae bacterium]